MRIALLAPLPPEKNGIADYASHFRNALQGLGIEVATPLAGVRPTARISPAGWTASTGTPSTWSMPNSAAAAWASSSPCASCASASRACR